VLHNVARHAVYVLPPRYTLHATRYTLHATRYTLHVSPCYSGAVKPKQATSFALESDYTPSGDQPKAISALAKGVQDGLTHQTLLGVTGSGKTFTVANVIEEVQKPTLVIAHNKTLAAQLAQEYRTFFPNNAVHYFVSYYDYYQPEAYLPVTDTYIEKEAMINAEIDRLRHASTQALLTRRDVIIVASVSCIYSLGAPEEYEKVHLKIEAGVALSRDALIRKLVELHFTRTTADLEPGLFRAVGNAVEIMPINERLIYRLEFEGSAVSSIVTIDALSRTLTQRIPVFFLFPAKHFVTPENERMRAIKDIEQELKERLKQLDKEGRILEAERLKRRTRQDIAMIREVGYCSGIENYSRHFDGRAPGDPPFTLLSYFPHKKDGTPDFLTVIDESHVTIPQLRGMYAGDRSRKETLVMHGFRLPSAIDNRPLKFEEFKERVGQCIYTSATPGEYEREESVSPHGQFVEQVIRPTGLIDPLITIKPVTGKTKGEGQVYDLMDEAAQAVKEGGRVLVTTLTKKMAEDLTEYLKERNVKAEYLHSDVKTIDRIQILTAFRKGEFDVLVGVNLLREGLDLPEVVLVGILDADKEGFLRSETSLIQTIGRAARNVTGRVILYADKTTGALEYAVNETNRRRKLQLAYNEAHGITPQTVRKEIKDITQELLGERARTIDELLTLDERAIKENPRKFLALKKREMQEAIKVLDFETAALLRDEIREIERRRGAKK
jgi:excinuclease ABC subunit B